jgi:hypothetical protein
LLVALPFFACNFSNAWEVDTHAWMTLEVYQRSLLNPSSVAGAAPHRRLGFDRLDPQAVFRSPGQQAVGGGTVDKYFDLLGSARKALQHHR